MEEALPVVAAGSCVTLIDEFGRVTRVVIDPDDVGELPRREAYATSTPPRAAALLGAVVGREVDLPVLAFGDSRRYTVTAIQSAYRKMLQVVHDCANALGGLPHMKTVHVGMTGDAAQDLAYMKAEVMRSSDISRRLFDDYGTGHTTFPASLSGKVAAQSKPFSTGRPMGHHSSSALVPKQNALLRWRSLIGPMRSMPSTG